MISGILRPRNGKKLIAITPVGSLLCEIFHRVFLFSLRIFHTLHWIVIILYSNEFCCTYVRGLVGRMWTSAFLEQRKLIFKIEVYRFIFDWNIPYVKCNVLVYRSHYTEKWYKRTITQNYSISVLKRGV